MAIAPMQKVQIFTHASRSAGVLKKLQDLEIIEITDIDEDFLSPAEPAEEDRCFQEALEILRALFPTAKNIIENFISVKVLANAPSIHAALARKNELQKTARDIIRMKTELDAARQQVGQYQAETERLQLYQHFTAATEKVLRLKKVRCLFGTFSPKGYLSWARKRTGPKTAPGPELHEEVLSQDKKHIYMLFCFLPELETSLKANLQQSGFNEVSVPISKIPFRKQLVRVQKELQRSISNETRLFERLRLAYQEHLAALSILADHAHNEEKVKNWGNNFLKTRKVAFIEGWIEKDRYPELVRAFQPFQKNIYLLASPASPDDQPPILLANKKMAPFEAVTTVYGFPLRQEFDPTTYIAPFFILFYGLCLSDAGYGFLLFLFCIHLLRKYKKHLTPYGKKLLTLNKYCGISTIFVGILTGSYFAINLSSLTYAPVRDLLLSMRIIDPVANPLPMLGFSLILGVIQIYTGLWLRYILDIRQKGHIEALQLSGLWVYFFTGAILWPLFSMAISVPVLAALGKLIVYSGVIGLVLTQGKHHKNPLMRLGSGIISLYRVTGFVGDILSYSRLFALGLVTSVLGMVINLLALMTRSVPVIGIGVMIIVLLLGHTFDFLINLLGSFVHPARLQYVEYFSKFFEGGGRVFRPFTWQARYIKVEK
jgi:V/A-type H+-transporting ATPase subunit I